VHLGVSGFRGDHRHNDNADRYALAGFLGLVQRGTVPRGSYLIVENLDRLTREHIRPALTLVLNLIDSGIKIVQLTPETILDEHTDEFQLMMVISELRRGNSESMRKSERNGAVWVAKRREAAKSGKPITGRVPFWLTVRDGRIEVIEEKAAIVRRIFRMSLDGKGIFEICKTLNLNKKWHRNSHWRTSNLAALLNNRQVLGEFQPHTGQGRNRIPVGKPIIGYYPAVIDEQTFYAVKGGLADRRRPGRKLGRPGKERVHLFSGLLRDARCGSKITYITVGKARATKLVNAKAQASLPGYDYVSFPAEVFEDCVLRDMEEVPMSAVLPEDNGANILSELAGRLADVEQGLDRAKADYKANPGVKTIIESVRELEADQELFSGQLAEERQRRLSGGLENRWGELKSLAVVAKTADAETRLRIRSAIRRCVCEVWCLFFGTNASEKTAFLQIYLTGGLVRHYMIFHQFQRKVPPIRPAKTRMNSSLDLIIPGDSDDLDMRDCTDRASMVETYRQIDQNPLRLVEQEQAVSRRAVKRSESSSRR
jgi:DNA invertase Pin-like site-specific DNA recombinase